MNPMEFYKKVQADQAKQQTSVSDINPDIDESQQANDSDSVESDWEPV